MGTNTNEPQESDSSLPFIDLFKTSLPFEEGRPHLTKGVVKYDGNGWPIYISPKGQAGTRLLNNLAGAVMPEGEYTVLYDGEGSIQYGLGAKLVRSSPGRDIIHLSLGKNNFFRAKMIITKTNPNNYLRNIRVLPPGGICRKNPFYRVKQASACTTNTDYLSFVEHYKTIIFNPDYLRFLQKFKVLRFMNMSGITRNKLTSWSQRPRVEHATWGGKEGRRGVPLEIMIKLANRMNMDPWLNIHHRANDEYVWRFAQYVNANLKPGLKAYIEYSNEVWNGLFRDQNKYMKEQGLAYQLDHDPNTAGHKYYSQRSVEIFKIFEKVMNGTDRLVRVLAGLTSNTKITNIMLGHKDAYQHVDAYAIAPYVFGDDKALKRARTVDQIFEIMSNPKYNYSLPSVIINIKEQAKVTDAYSVDLIAYEGGQHLVDMNARRGNQAISNKLFFAANRDPLMGDIYDELLEGWKEAGGKMFVHFTSPRMYDKFGSKGLKEYVTQADKDAPKFLSVMRFIKNNPCWWPNCAHRPNLNNNNRFNTQQNTQQNIPVVLPHPTPDLSNQVQQHDKAGIFLPALKKEPNTKNHLHSASSIVSNIQKRPPDRRKGGIPIYPQNSNKRQTLHRLNTIIGGRINGRKDLEVSWNASWDKRNLYLAFHVQDDFLIKDSKNFTQDDQIEILLDLDASQSNTFDHKNDFQLLFSPANRRIQLGALSPRPTSFRAHTRVQKNTSGYKFSITIPWRTVGIKPQPGYAIAAAVIAYDDDDGHQADGILAWRIKKNANKYSPAHFQRMVLAP